MQTKKSNQNLKKANILEKIVKKQEVSALPEIDSW